MGSPGTYEPAADPYRRARELMVDRQLEARGVRDQRVLAAMRIVPRHLFVPEHLAGRAYDDCALALSEGQTISQPYIVGYMTQLLDVGEDGRVLEIGTGSGYQAAVLAEIVREVCTVEIRPALALSAEERLARLGYANVRVRCGDGGAGWPGAGEFDGIIVTAAADRIPEALLGQLGFGARLVLPLGEEVQRLHAVTRTPDGVRDEALIGVRFVPFVRPAREAPFNGG